MDKVVWRIADVELEEILGPDSGWAAVCFFEFRSISCGYFRVEFEKFAWALMDSVYCAEISCEENPTITAKCGVVAVPTTLILCAGKEVGRYEGPYSAESLKVRVEELLKS